MTEPLDIDERDVKLFQETVKKHTQYDFSDYSINSLKRRLIKVLTELGPDMNSMIRKIETNKNIMEEVIRKITVHTTELFRDPDIWQEMLHKLLPRYSSLHQINIWHTGCSTGEEVYSMLILLDQLGLFEKSNIYATDLNPDVLSVSAEGKYRLNFNREYIENFNTVFFTGKNGNYAPLKNYFRIDEVKGQIIMKDFLVEKPVYEVADLVKSKNPFSIAFDIILCRNVIIYFNYDLQNKVLGFFHKNLADNGSLVLGHHESIIGPGTSLFQKNNHFYVKRT